MNDQTADLSCLEVFAIEGDRNLIAPKHLGIFNGRATVSVPYRDMMSMRGLFAPPYSSPDFDLQVRLFGEVVPTRRYKWYPHKVDREGAINGVRVRSTLCTVCDARAIVLQATLTSEAATDLDVPFQIALAGGLNYERQWGFLRPTEVWPCQGECLGNRLTLFNHCGAISIATDAPDPRWEPWSGHWNAIVPLTRGASVRIRVIVAIGEKDESVALCERQLPQYDAIAQMDRRVESQVRGIFDRLPSLYAEDRGLEQLYTRSLVYLLLNRWDVPEFKLRPFYSTGGINGGCVGAYLWDFSESWELMPLYDPDAAREHIKAFMSVDLTRHFAIMPMNGEGFGPHYYINQEKIIFLTYYYVLLTGDTAFLRERVNDQPVIQHVIDHALYRDDPAGPVRLIDYGIGNHHLELRKRFVYDHYLPDLNGRRYDSYHAAAALCDIAGVTPPADMRRRAEQLKRLLNDELWSEADRWYVFRDPAGRTGLRYTVQMFKLIGSGVLDDKHLQGLLSHLNEDEFLSDYGLHSMSKRDEAYDQVDIDNGGGGICVCFPPQIMERLYRIGRADLAQDILKRILWWGDRFAYWGDSIVANQKDYRRDTPLQNAIGGLAVAQSIIFGMFGVRVDAEGNITINPAPPTFSPRVGLTNLRLRDRVCDIRVEGDRYHVTCDGQTMTAQVGTPTTLPCRPKAAAEPHRKRDAAIQSSR
ncbi:MAG TPA: hypothetical protein VF184_13080 [Phycisphaeraceae bacterium]